MPILGLTRVDHIGITVPDLDQAREFFEDVLGFEYLYLRPLRPTVVGPPESGVEEPRPGETAAS